MPKCGPLTLNVKKSTCSKTQWGDATMRYLSLMRFWSLVVFKKMLNNAVMLLSTSVLIVVDIIKNNQFNWAFWHHTIVMLGIFFVTTHHCLFFNIFGVFDDTNIALSWDLGALFCFRAASPKQSIWRAIAPGVSLHPQGFIFRANNQNYPHIQATFMLKGIKLKYYSW